MRDRDAKYICCFTCKTLNKKGIKRTEIYTFPLTWWSLVIPIILMSLLFLFQTLYHDKLLAFTMGDHGTILLQSKVPAGIRTVFRFLTEFGGGLELFDAWVICLFFGTRSKSFYYLAMVALDKTVVNYLKLAMAQPRPYMINSKIHPFTCSTGFGMPSGHSSASICIGIVIFLDIFHGKSEPYFNTLYVKWWQYFFGLLLCVFWACCMPFTRFLLGAHSLDQIVYGISNGLFEGLILHFFVRDHFIAHIENVLAV